MPVKKKKGENGHSVRGSGFVSGIVRDIRFSFRMLRKNIGYTAIAIIMLALGVSGNFINFSVYNGFYLRPLPLPGGERVVDLNETAPLWGLEYVGLRYSDFNSWRDENRSFEVMGAGAFMECNLSFEGTPERVSGTRVTHDFLSVLGVTPIIGRLFTPDEDRPGGEKVILLGNGFWQRRFGGNEDVVGQVVKLDGEPFTIIGVSPPGKDLFSETAFWTPLQGDPNRINGNYYLTGLGRLKENVSIATAREDLRRIHSGLVEKNRALADTAPVVTKFKDRHLGSFRLSVQVWLACVLVVLLIACSNVAALMLARGLARSREYILRRSLGATPRRLARLIGMESLILAVSGGVAGVVLGHWGLKMLLNSTAVEVPQPFNFHPDWRVWLFVGLMVVISAFLGVLPVIRSVLKLKPRDTLKSSTLQSTMAAPGRRSMRFLIIAELALTLILMINSGLLVQSLRSVLRVDPGFRSDNMLIYNIALPEKKYGSKEVNSDFFREHLERVRHLPGVISAGAIDLSPLSGGHNGGFYIIENAPPKKPDESQPVVLFRSVFPGYFEAMEIPIVVGRSFNEQDGQNRGSLSVIVDEAFAKRSWPGDNPIGKRICPGMGNVEGSPELPWITVVGVARDVKHYGLDKVGHAGIYLPYTQQPRNTMSIILHTSVEPAGIVPSIRELVRKRDADLPLFGVATMADRLSKSMALNRLIVGNFCLFSSIALLMAIVGVYGVFSYVVGRRTQEIGIRIALGARKRDVLWVILKENLVLALIGIVIGVIGALMMAPLMRSLLVGISPFDPITFVGISLLLTVVSMLACWLPACRAMKVQPMEALRYE